MRNTGLHKQYIQNVNILPGGCRESWSYFPAPPRRVLTFTCWPSWCLGGEVPRGNINSLALSSVFDIIDQYQMASPCPSAGNVILSGVGDFDAMAPEQDVDVRPNNGYASPSGVGFWCNNGPQMRWQLESNQRRWESKRLPLGWQLSHGAYHCLYQIAPI